MASASAAPAAVTHAAALPAGTPIPAHPQDRWPDCDMDLLGSLLCLNL